MRRNGDEEVFWWGFGVFFLLLDVFVVVFLGGQGSWFASIIVWFYSIVQFSSLILICVSQ